MNFRIAQLNMLNNPEGFEDRCATLAEHMAYVEPTVITLQEVVDPTSVEKALEPLGYSFSAFTEPFATGFNGRKDCVGVVSKIPLSSMEIELGVSERPALSAELKYGNDFFKVIAAHFAWGSKAEHTRLLQAEAVNAIAEDYSGPQRTCLLSGDLNAAEESRSLRFLGGLDLASNQLTSTFWTDAYQVAGNAELWATTDQGKGYWGPRTAAPHGVRRFELMPERRIDYILAHGWLYGKIGCPIAYGRFGGPTGGKDELSDHYGIWADILSS